MEIRLLDRSKSSAPVLADGTSILDLLDRDKREVSTRVLMDREIYELELEKLWSKAWILLGHESEIPERGDFVTREIGEDRVILVRQKDGSIECLLNVCPHRAMQICRTDRGNAQAFRCIYHGWIFNQDGSFRGAPFDKEMYPPDYEADRAMRRARVELFGGLIFVNWDAEAPGLDDFLGDISWYLRLIFDRTERGFEILGAPQRYMIDANWKLAAEQAVGDGYHSQTLHRSLADFGLLGDDANDSRSWGLHNFKVSANGHGLICLDLRSVYAGIAAAGGGEELSFRQKLVTAPPAGLPPELVDDFVARFSEADLSAFADSPPSVGALFPNIHVIAFYSPDPEGGVVGTFGIHSFVPKGPDKFEFIHWNFVEKGASEEFRNKTLRTSVFGVGASGVVEQDDSEVWPAIQQSAKGFIGRQMSLKYHAAAEPTTPDNWGGGGLIYSGFGKDDNQWNWWNRYFDYLSDQA
jgi:phenylpropionate dioxygenase-like ring-hydroxylating dioxygenase large terminal subunit